MLTVCNATTDKRPKDLKIKPTTLIPKKGLVYDSFCQFTNYGSWNVWASLVSKPTIDSKQLEVGIFLYCTVMWSTNKCSDVEYEYFNGLNVKSQKANHFSRQKPT